MVEASFYGLPFELAPGAVFTPRPSTEKLVARALELIGDRRDATVADVGTGSGAIAVAVAANAPSVEVWATDISPEAVQLARRNAERHGVADRVHVVEGDLLEPVTEQVDLVLANLPYLPEATRLDAAHAELLDEPVQAVYAPGDGLGPLRSLVGLCEHGKLRMPGFVLVQFHRQVFEADCQHLPELRERLVRDSRAAA
jgi:release factor glutamine methyltransferase